MSTIIPLQLLWQIASSSVEDLIKAPLIEGMGRWLIMLMLMNTTRPPVHVHLHLILWQQTSQRQIVDHILDLLDLVLDGIAATTELVVLEVELLEH